MMSSEKITPLSPAMTVKEAATFLNCKRSHVFRLIHSGQVSYQRLGDHFVVRRSEIEALLSRGWLRNAA